MQNPNELSPKRPATKVTSLENLELATASFRGSAPGT